MAPNGIQLHTRKVFLIGKDKRDGGAERGESGQCGVVDTIGRRDLASVFDFISLLTPMSAGSKTERHEELLFALHTYVRPDGKQSMFMNV